MSIFLFYESKKALKESIGKPLDYQETSFFGPEVSDNCTVTGNNRPSLTGRGYKREFMASVTLVNGLITKVS